MSPHPDSYFHKQAGSLLPSKDASFWYATYDNKVIATALFFDSKTTRIYAHAAANSTPEYRKLNAGTALLTEAIIDAKHRQMEKVDLYGIAPENAPKITHGLVLRSSSDRSAAKMSTLGQPGNFP